MTRLVIQKNNQFGHDQAKNICKQVCEEFDLEIDETQL